MDVTIHLDSRNEGNRLALEIGECVAEGEKLSDIAVRLGCEKVGQLRMWLEAEPGRKAAYEAGLRAYVEGSMLEALARNREVVGIADGCDDPEMVDLAKLRIEGRDKYVKNAVLLAERVDGGRWGRGVDKGMQVAENLSAVLRAISERNLAKKRDEGMERVVSGGE